MGVGDSVMEQSPAHHINEQTNGVLYWLPCLTQLVVLLLRLWLGCNKNSDETFFVTNRHMDKHLSIFTTIRRIKMQYGTSFYKHIIHRFELL